MGAECRRRLLSGGDKWGLAEEAAIHSFHWLLKDEQTQAHQVEQVWKVVLISGTVCRKCRGIRTCLGD